MTTDEAFRKAYWLLDKAQQIWHLDVREKFQKAQEYYEEALAIKAEYFDKKDFDEAEGWF